MEVAAIGVAITPLVSYRLVGLMPLVIIATAVIVATLRH